MSSEQSLKGAKKKVDKLEAGQRVRIEGEITCINYDPLWYGVKFENKNKTTYNLLIWPEDVLPAEIPFAVDAEIQALRVLVAFKQVLEEAALAQPSNAFASAALDEMDVRNIRDSMRRAKEWGKDGCSVSCDTLEKLLTQPINVQRVGLNQGTAEAPIEVNYRDGVTEQYPGKQENRDVSGTPEEKANRSFGAACKNALEMFDACVEQTSEALILCPHCKRHFSFQGFHCSAIAPEPKP
jgi:hypothetical protein